jgi:hypothetical protein
MDYTNLVPGDFFYTLHKKPFLPLENIYRGSTVSILKGEVLVFLREIYSVDNYQILCFMDKKGRILVDSVRSDVYSVQAGRKLILEDMEKLK